MYRYKPVNEYILDEFREGYIYFNAPIEFNDPLEFQYDLSKVDIGARYWAGLAAEKVNGIITRHDFENGVSKCKAVLSDALSLKRSQLLNEIGVCCFSKRDNNFLMWSHYSNGHRGICIKYNKNLFIEGGENKIIEIRYEADYPDIPLRCDSGIDGEQLAKNIMSVKNKEWFYEEEMRVYHNRSRAKYFLPKNSIDEIIFGIKCSEDNENKIRDLVLANNESVNFKKARITDLCSWNITIE